MISHAISNLCMFSPGKEDPWLIPIEDQIYDTTEPTFLELHAMAILCLPSGECMPPDATLCATLMSALYSSVPEEVVSNRQLTVNDCHAFFFFC